MSRADRYLRACRREEPDCTPIWFMRQAGRYLPEYRAIRSKVGFLELCKTPDLAAEVTIQPVTRLGVDAAILFSDILVVSEAMGMALELEDKGPHFPEPLRSHADVDRLRVPDPEQALGFVLETIRAAKKRLAGTVPLIGFCGGPWTLAAYMIEGKTSRSFEKAKAALLGDEPLAFALLSKISDALIAYLQAQIDVGAACSPRLAPRGQGTSSISAMASCRRRLPKMQSSSSTSCIAKPRTPDGPIERAHARAASDRRLPRPFAGACGDLKFLGGNLFSKPRSQRCDERSFSPLLPR